MYFQPSTNEDQLLPRTQASKSRIAQLKKFILYSILIIYAIFLSFSSLIWLITMSKMDTLCSSYLPYFCLILFGSLSYLCMIGGNILSIFKKDYSKNLVLYCMMCLGLGTILKAAFVIYSFVIYNRSYGDCYLPYKKQFYYIIGCVAEAIWLGMCFIYWKKEERLKLFSR